jgi:hypothetical protein
MTSHHLPGGLRTPTDATRAVSAEPSQEEVVMTVASETPTIVLVHGAWADAAGFDVAPDLSNRQYPAGSGSDPQWLCSAKSAIGHGGPHRRMNASLRRLRLCQ